MHNTCTKLAQEVCAELNLDPSFVQNVRVVDEYVYITINGGSYTAKLTKNGKLKKGSVRYGN